MSVYVFADSNVLLQYRLFDEVDWAGQLGVSEMILVFAPVVFSELDKFKWSGTRRQKDRARAVLKRLSTLALSTTPVSVRKNVQAIALDAEPEDILFSRHRLHPQSNDDRLLASHLGFSAEHPGERVLILSADSGLAAKARSRRIELVAPDDSLELPDEPGEVERELEKARRELAAATSAAPDLSLTFGNSETRGEFDVRLVKAIDASTLGRLLDAWRKRYPHVSAMPQSITGPGGVEVSLGGLAGFPGFLSEKEASEYNAGVDRVCREYEAFLASWDVAVNARRRILKFELSLENTGTAPAHDVDVMLWTDAPGVWRDELPKAPRAPGLKKRRSPFDIPFPRIPNLDYLANIRSPVLANEDGPNISGEAPDQRVGYTVKRAMHHVPCALPAVYFQFASDDAVSSFAVQARLVAANIRKPVATTLHVKVNRPEPCVPPPPPHPTEEFED